MSKIIISLKNLHNAAARAIIEKINDGEHTAKELAAALEDGEFLAANGFTDADIPAIDASCGYLNSLRTYEVQDAVLGAEAGNLSAEAMKSYEDDFVLGSFASDEEALEAVSARQSADDADASETMGGIELTAGPCYAAHIYRIEGDDEINVEA